jgi:hypothetical protein
VLQGSSGVFSLHIWQWGFILSSVTVDLFEKEMAQAMKAYETYVICIDKTPEEFHASLISLISKAIKAFENRGPQLRHGIALDKHLTVILSQSDGDRPLCGIYFNLHSPYQKQSLPRSVKPISEKIGEGRSSSES